MTHPPHRKNIYLVSYAKHSSHCISQGNQGFCMEHCIALLTRAGLVNLGSPFLLPPSPCITLFFLKHDSYPSTTAFINVPLNFCWQKSISQNLSWIHPKIKSRHNSAHIHSSRGKKDILNKQKLANRSIDIQTWSQSMWVCSVLGATSLSHKK